MSQTASSSKQQKYDAGVARVDTKLEVALIAVSDVDRAKAFYTRLGWRLDDDIVMGDDFRVVQLTPPGSGCSISLGKGVTTAAPGSFRGGLIVSDIEAAHDELVASGINASEVFHGSPFSPAGASAARIPSARVTAHTSPSKIPTATRGSSRRSGAGCPVASIPRQRPLHPQTIWQARCAAPQPPAASTRCPTRTGRTGTQRTWRRSRQGPSCRCELGRSNFESQVRLIAVLVAATWKICTNRCWPARDFAAPSRIRAENAARLIHVKPPASINGCLIAGTARSFEMSSITVHNETLGSVTLPSKAHGHSGSMSVKTTKQLPLRHLVYLTLLATLATAHTVWAQATAAPPISGVIGKLQSFDGKSLDVATSSGVVHVSVKQPLTTYKQIPSDLSHVASAPYIGVASAEQDGKQVAKQIFIFPAELSGAAEGSVLTDPPGATTHSRMTNGTVSRPSVSHSRMTNGTVEKGSGTTLVVRYQDGSQTISVPPNVPVTEVAPEKVTFSPGDVVYATTQKLPDGTLVTDKIFQFIPAASH